ncbi:MAG: hypothetical protein ACJ8DL_22070 [Microvirga sp.]
MVEIKSSKRTAQPASAAPPNNSDDLISGDLPARDIQAFLIDGPMSREALREADKVFSRFAGDQPSVHTTNGGKAPLSPDAEPSAPLVRVLPDLLAAAREHERTAALMPERKRASNSSKTVQRRRKALVEHRMLDPDPLRADEPKNLTQLTSHAEAAMAMSRRGKRSRAQLSPGERWKERRLPKVCWDRRRARTQ